VPPHEILCKNFRRFEPCRLCTRPENARAFPGEGVHDPRGQRIIRSDDGEADAPEAEEATTGSAREIYGDLIGGKLDEAGIELPGEEPQEQEVEKFREFLDQISPEDFQ
jgi:hypothetical protein